MSDDVAIKNILLELGLYSLAMAYLGSERELFKMFKTDFETLMRMCAKEFENDRPRTFVG